MSCLVCGARDGVAAAAAIPCPPEVSSTLVLGPTFSTHDMVDLERRSMSTMLFSAAVLVVL